MARTPKSSRHSPAALHAHPCREDPSGRRGRQDPSGRRGLGTFVTVLTGGARDASGAGKTGRADMALRSFMPILAYFEENKIA